MRGVGKAGEGNWLGRGREREGKERGKEKGKGGKGEREREGQPPKQKLWLRPWRRTGEEGEGREEEGRARRRREGREGARDGTGRGYLAPTVISKSRRLWVVGFKIKPPSEVPAHPGCKKISGRF